MLRELQLAAGSRLPGGRVNMCRLPHAGTDRYLPGDPGEGEPHDIPPRIPRRPWSGRRSTWAFFEPAYWLLSL
jgi:hypothetical protein